MVIVHGADMKIDCHCHTIYSKHIFWGFDALDTPLNMIKAAIKKGIDGMVISDHNTVRGSLIAKNIAKRFKDFTIITGDEVRTREGEMIALDIKENVPINLSIEETVEKIHELGGIATAPHPFGSYFFRKCVGKKGLMADALEVYNATLTNRQNKEALDMAKLFKKSMTAGSDAHSVREVGNAGIIVEGDPIDAILKNKLKVFGKQTPVLEIMNRSYRKFARSIGWRISGRRREYTQNPIYSV
jgi:predicted metal-dependent phosphoesterase TrpH